MECSICMENIHSFTNNCVTTECGHSFHTNCLMKNVARNGFGCPYCRTKMAEELDYSSSEESFRDDYNSSSDDDDGSYNIQGIDDEDEDNLLRGFRLFFNNVNGEVFDKSDEDLEDTYEEYIVNKQINNLDIIPDMKYITDKLTECNFEYQDCLKLICADIFNNEHEYDYNLSWNLNNNIINIVQNYQDEYLLAQKKIRQQKIKEGKILIKSFDILDDDISDDDDLISDDDL